MPDLSESLALRDLGAPTRCQGGKPPVRPNNPPAPDGTVPDQLTKWTLEHRRDISAASADMIEEFNETHGPK